jgi:hypothetical protein
MQDMKLVDISGRNNKMEYLKAQINELGTNSTNRNVGDMYKCINGFTHGYQPRANLANFQKDDLLAHSHTILNRWKNQFCKLLNYSRQTEVHTAEPLVSQPSASEVETATETFQMFQ